MSETTRPKKGDTVRFKPGPKAKSTVEAKVVADDGDYLTTKDDAGVQRKVRAGACTIV